MKVLAIDPGERVGWAHGVVTSCMTWPDGMAVREAELLPEGKSADDGAWEHRLEVTGHGISSLKDFALKLHEVAGDYDVIIYETYRISASKLRYHVGSNVPTLQLIGMIRLCAWLHPQVRLIDQGPDLKKTADSTMPDWLRAKIESLPKAHDDSHDGDALRHLWVWFFKKYV